MEAGSEYGCGATERAEIGGGEGFMGYQICGAHGVKHLRDDAATNSPGVHGELEDVEGVVSPVCS